MSHAVSVPPDDELYDRDLVLWSEEQARLLEARRFGDLDLENLIDEVRAVGLSEKREIRSRLAVLIVHLLKWRYQPGRRTSSWMATIDEQRQRVAGVLDDSPSLRRHVEQVLPQTFISARLRASRETGLDYTVFPKTSPFTIDQVLDPGFLPKHPDLDDQTS